MNDFLKQFPTYLTRTILVICFLVLVTTFTTRLFQLIFNKPEYNTYCPDSLYAKQYGTEKDCVADGGQWSSYAVAPTLEETRPTKDAITGSCNITYTCNKAYESANKIFERNMFIAIVAIGLLLLLISTFVTLHLLSIALMVTGGFIAIYGALRYFGNVPELVRVIFLGVGIAVLLYIIIKRQKNN